MYGDGGIEDGIYDGMMTDISKQYTKYLDII